MFEDIYTASWHLNRHRLAPLGRERARFLAHLKEMGVSPAKIQAAAAGMLDVIRVLDLTESGNVTPAAIRQAAQRWIDSDSSKTIKSKGHWRSHFVNVATKWLRFMGRLHSPPVAAKPFAAYVTSFKAWMQAEKGFASTSIQSHEGKVRQFLTWLYERKPGLELASIRDVDDFLAYKSGQGWRRWSLSTAAQALRTFFRYGEGQGWCQPGIAKLIIAPLLDRKENLPAGPAWNQVRKLVDDARGPKPSDYRARAILLLLAVYALRSGEVTELRLSDFDWEAEMVTIRREKGGGSRQYPLVREVGDAVLDYLRHARPRCDSRHLFVTLHPPHDPIARSAVWTLTSRRFAKLGIECLHRGPHALRHACASHLLQTGSTLKEIGDLLGHRDANSTAIYAKVDLPMLRRVADVDLGGLS